MCAYDETANDDDLCVNNIFFLYNEVKLEAFVITLMGGH